MNTKRMCHLAVLTALYVVTSAMLRIPLISNVWLDIGYLTFSVALCLFGLQGAVVGVIGCAIESILFSAYGLSISWVVANTIIGVWCGLWFQKTEKFGQRVIAVVLSNFLGFAVMKTVIDCSLWSIPVAVKLPTSLTAFVTDSAVMIFGVLFYGLLKRRLQHGQA